MKKNLIHIVLVALFAVFAFPQQADAQLGGLLKKSRKVLKVSPKPPACLPTPRLPALKWPYPRAAP